MPSFGYSPWDSDDDDDDILFGSFRATIVGIRYYRGQVNNHEMVSLIREPRNPYDCNAVRIDNVFGVQVGHIKREQAKAIASVVDSNQARVEGVVPFGMNNKFSMPCDVSFYGKEEDRHNVMTVMASNGYPLSANSFGSGGSYGLSSQYEGPGSGVLSKAVKISSSVMKQNLDQLFDKLEETNKTVSVEPAEVIKTNLFLHQRQALAWMIDRENTNELPPFWEEKVPGKEYFSRVTNFTATKRPKSIHGGILADDMGLGKTLEVIALIVSNFKNGKPLATINKNKPIMLAEGKECLMKVPKKNRKKIKSSKIAPATPCPSDEMSQDTEELPQLPQLPDILTGPVVVDDEIINNAEVAMTVEVESSVDDQEKKPLMTINPINVIEEESSSKAIGRKSKRNAGKKVKYNFDDDYIYDEEEEENGGVKKRKKDTTRDPIVIEDETMEKDIEDSDSVYDVNSSPKSRKGSKKQKPKKQNVKLDVVDSDYVPDLAGSQDTIDEDAPVSTFQCKKTKAAGPRATLIICPLSVLSNWQDQVESHVYAGVIDIYTYHGSDRMRDCDELSQKDIVLTTYQTLGAEYSKGNSPLLATQWLRVVLDEGHSIRNPSALQSKAAHGLKADRRWVVTGTPLQNSMKDLWSIICFLKLDPFTDRQWWRRTMERPIAQGEREGLKRVQQLMKKIAMRRTKTQQVNGKPIVDLPERKIILQKIQMSKEERDVYQAVANQGRVTLGKYVKAGTMLKNYTQVLVILTRLRQLCCHPSLCSDALAAAAKGLENATPEELKNKLLAILNVLLNSGIDEECPICLEVLALPVITHCAHVYCRKCIENVIATDPGMPPRCPLCRRDIVSEQLVEPSLEEEKCRAVKDGSWVSSSKVDALMMSLANQRKNDPTQKCIIVSQFTSFLSMLEKPLRTANFNFVKLDGSLSQKKRSIIMKSFSETDPSSPMVMLLSLKAGGQGINLTAANRVYLMDPAWNPASEDQCFDRCHRLGQTKEVQIVKFVMEDSVEERMLELQEKKRELIAGAFTKKQTAEAKRQQRIDDLQSILQF